MQHLALLVEHRAWLSHDAEVQQVLHFFWAAFMFERIPVSEEEGEWWLGVWEKGVGIDGCLVLF